MEGRTGVGVVGNEDGALRSMDAAGEEVGKADVNVCRGMAGMAPVGEGRARPGGAALAADA